MGETYYEVLGVSTDATAEEIEQAYRERLKETHPDVSDRTDASERTKLLIEARDTLTDETERRRYDRLGHDAYVTGSGAAAGDGTGPDDRNAGTARSSTTSGGQENRGRGRRRDRQHSGGERRKASKQETYTENVGTGAAWAQRTSRSSTGESTRPSGRRSATGGDASRVWKTWNRAYDVRRGQDLFGLAGLAGRQHSLVLLATTFLVYPVLLFGALSTDFPLALNLFVACCVVFVIAFLQSVPEVGIVVFAGWTVLLPPVLFFGFKLSPFSIQAVLALTAVVFPLGLSALIRVAIRPVTVN